MSVIERAKEECSEIGQAMKVFTMPYVGAVYGAFDENFGELIGSGLFIEFDGYTFLLTAGHNLTVKQQRGSDGELKYVNLCASNGQGGTPQVLGLGATWPQPYDLGLVQVDLPSDKRAFNLAGEMAATSSRGYQKDLLFAHGLPGARSHSLFGVHSDTLPHTSAFRRSQYDWFDQRIHVCIEYSPDDLYDEQGQTTDFTDPHGMSGCPLWRTNRSTMEALGDWHPAASKLIGIVHNWDDKAYCLVGTRIEVVRRFVEEAVPLLLSKRRHEVAPYGTTD